MIVRQQFGQQTGVMRRYQPLPDRLGDTRSDQAKQGGCYQPLSPVTGHVTRSVPVWVQLPPAPQNGSDQPVLKIANHGQHASDSRWTAESLIPFETVNPKSRSVTAVVGIVGWVS